MRASSSLTNIEMNFENTAAKTAQMGTTEATQC